MTRGPWGISLPSREPWGPHGVEWIETEEQARKAAIATARANPGCTVTLVRRVAEVRCPVGDATWEQPYDTTPTESNP